MFELLCGVPEYIGWVIVGAVGMLTAIMAAKVGKSFILLSVTA